MATRIFRGLFIVTGLALLCTAPSLADTAPTCWPKTAAGYGNLGCGASTPFVCITYAPDQCSDSSKFRPELFQCVSDSTTCRSPANPIGLTDAAKKQLASGGLGSGLNAHANGGSATVGAPVAGGTDPAKPAAGGTAPGQTVAGATNGGGPSTTTIAPDGTVTIVRGGGTQQGGNQANQGDQANQSNQANSATRKNTPAAGGDGTQPPDAQDPTAPGNTTAAGTTGNGGGGKRASQNSNNSDNSDADPNAPNQKEEKANNAISNAANGLNPSSNASGCDKSSSLGYGCQGTKDIVEAAKITNQVGNVAGSLVVGAAGSSAQQQALANGGSTTDALLAAAKTQETAAKLQIGLGGANAILGTVQLLKGSAASKNANYLNSHLKAGNFQADKGGPVTSNDQLANRIMTKDSDPFQAIDTAYSKAYNVANTQAALSPANAAQAQEAQKEAAQKAQAAAYRSANAYAGAAASEQKNVADVANAGGLTSLVAAAQQLAEGYFNYKGAQQLEQAAMTLANANNGAATLTPPASDNFPGTSTGALGSTTITGNGVAPQTAAAVGSSGSAAGGDLGPPVPGDPNAGSVGPGGTPAPWNPGAGSPAGGGGSAAGLGGASTPAATPDNTPTNPTAASNNTGTQYAGTDARPSGNMGGGGFGGGGGLDLEKIAGLFGKKEEGDKTPGDAAFGGRGYREIASDNSVLGPDANLFHNVHERLNTIQFESLRAPQNEKRL